MSDPERSGGGVCGVESNYQQLLRKLAEQGDNTALDVDLIKSMSEMGMRDPATRVMLERVCTWKAGDLAASPQYNPPNPEVAGEDLEIIDDPAATLIDSIINSGGPKVAIFPDSFPIKLEESYLSARSCGNTTAVTLIQDAAEKRYHLAEACLSALYERRCEGLARDPEQAELYASRSLPWLQTHARRGNKYAQYHLGDCCADGRGVEKNQTEAVLWYTLAAEKSHAPAQCSLGVCYERGAGVPEDRTEATRLLNLAADQGHIFARKCLETLQLRITGTIRLLSKARLVHGKRLTGTVMAAEMELVGGTWVAGYHEGARAKFRTGGSLRSVLLAHGKGSFHCATLAFVYEGMFIQDRMEELHLKNAQKVADGHWVVPLAAQG